MTLALPDIVIFLWDGRLASTARGIALSVPKTVMRGSFPCRIAVAGGASNSLFGDDLYAYPMGKHNRPPFNRI